jgi:hypothetical protein
MAIMCVLFSYIIYSDVGVIWQPFYSMCDMMYFDVY